ncbi:RPM1 interacting protein 13-like [Bidens hawaiensis]|uniref:RPM1 interacting protein 13-like n=1 Tax=Bidens hawaiensis TaxID=980011 RepID=UPI0040497D32
MADSIQILSTPKRKRKTSPIQCLSDIDIDDDSPLRPIFCLKRKSAIKEFDDKEDCFILEFNPEEEEQDTLKCDLGFQDSSPDICMVAEKGKVACRDYPHSRHLCVKHLFEKTSHESYCKLCYCFVCDVAALCKSWSGYTGHCHAIDNEGWKAARKSLRKGRTN